MITFTYDGVAKTRLDKYLQSQQPTLSRSVWQKRVKSGSVLVNNRRVLPHHFIKAGDIITLMATPEKDEPETKRNPTPAVLTETADYLIINKPAGLTVHKPHAGSDLFTLADWLIETYPQLRHVGEHPLRPGIMHRLDKNVSGVMVIARNQEMYLTLKRQFQSRRVEKTYVGLVYGRLSDAAGTINFRITRSRDGKLVARPTSQDGKDAITGYETIKQYQHFTYLKLLPKTGRTHQIRLHLNAIGHPLVGERLHLPKNIKPYKDLNRIFLHALRISFSDLTSSRQTYESPLPPELKHILASL